MYYKSVILCFSTEETGIHKRLPLQLQERIKTIFSILIKQTLIFSAVSICQTLCQIYLRVKSRYHIYLDFIGPHWNISLRGVHTVVHEAILPRTFVRVRPSQSRTRTKVRVRVRVRRPPTMLDFCTSYTCTTYKCSSLLYSDELIIIAGVSNQNCVLQDIHYKLLY